jgi:hypothetical protein
MKAAILARSGKWVEITFVDGEKIEIFRALEAGRTLGIDNVSCNAMQSSFNKPLICSSGKYSGREIVFIKYLAT